jgi:uncharacterized coiled-coil DUF342 family protein
MNYLELIAPTILAVIGFLIRSYFNQIKKDIVDLSNSIAKLEGKFSPLHDDLKGNTIELTKLQSELKALWRFVEAPKRRSEM